MPFIIQTLKGKEKVVEAVLRKNGVDSTISPLKEFIICEERPHTYIYDIPQVLHVIEVTPEEVENLLNDRAPEQKAIEIGNLIEIVSGEYAGFTGLVRNIRNGEATVDLNIFGKMLPVDVQIQEVKHAEFGKQWI